MKLHALFLAVMLGATVLPAHAGLFSDDEARRRVEQVRQDFDARIKKVESSNETILQNQRDLNNQLEKLRQDLADLRGQVEVLGNDNDQSQQRQNAFYNDLDTRLRKLEAAISQAQSDVDADGSAPVAQKKLDPAQEPKDYEAAINMVRGGKYEGAVKAFKQFIVDWPKSSFQPGAHFWAAESMMRVHDYKGAQKFYGELIAKWPDDQLAPDALLGLSNAQKSDGDAKAAHATLEKLVARFPKSDAGKTAKIRLKKK